MKFVILFGVFAITACANQKPDITSRFTASAEVNRDTVPCPRGLSVNHFDRANSFGEAPARYEDVFDYEVRCTSEDKVEIKSHHEVSRDTVPCPSGMHVNRFELDNRYGEAPYKWKTVFDYEVRCVR